MTDPMTTAAPTYGWRLLRHGKSLGLFAGLDEDAAIEIAERAGKILGAETGETAEEVFAWSRLYRERANAAVLRYAGGPGIPA